MFLFRFITAAVAPAAQDASRHRFTSANGITASPSRRVISILATFIACDERRRSRSRFACVISPFSMMRAAEYAGLECAFHDFSWATSRPAHRCFTGPALRFHFSLFICIRNIVVDGPFHYIVKLIRLSLACYSSPCRLIFCPARPYFIAAYYSRH